MNELRYFFTTREDGNMTTQPKFYKEGMTKKEIREDFDTRRIDFGLKQEINGLRIVVPTMKTGKNYRLYPDGKSVRITEKMLSGYEDLYDFDVEADILTMGSDLTDTVLAYPVADYPVVFVHDTYEEAVGMAYCSSENINRELPSQIIDAMKSTFGSKVYNLSVYVGPFIHAENYTCDRCPKWATNEQAWRECIWKYNGIYHIDLETAIIKQLVGKGMNLGSIYASAYDTFTNDKFYSNRASVNNPSKAGRFYEGCYYTYEGLEKTKVKTR